MAPRRPTRLAGRGGRARQRGTGRAARLAGPSVRARTRGRILLTHIPRVCSFFERPLAATRNNAKYGHSISGSLFRSMTNFRIHRNSRRYNRIHIIVYILLRSYLFQLSTTMWLEEWLKREIKPTTRDFVQLACKTRIRALLLRFYFQSFKRIHSTLSRVRIKFKITYLLLLQLLAH